MVCFSVFYICIFILVKNPPAALTIDDAKKEDK